MMSIVAQVPCTGTSTSGDCSGGSGGGGTASDTGASGGSSAALFADGFREEEMTVPQLAALLRAAGMQQHWGAATGLPHLPPA